MQLIKEQSFTDRIFLEVLDHGFQPRKAPTSSQHRINYFHVSALTISSTVHCASVHATLRSPSQTISAHCTVKHYLSLKIVHLRFIYISGLQHLFRAKSTDRNKLTAN